MLFQVQISVRLPHGADMEEISKLSATEIELAKKLQRDGKWRHIWRIPGQWANISIFNVGDTEELDRILHSLPLFPYMEIKILPLCRHPASIEDVRD
jgi:muconolactone D-isomerase